MAKKKAGKRGSRSVNKAEIVRQALAKDPDGSPSKIAARLGHGIDPQYVSTIRSKMRTDKKSSKGRGRPKRTKRAARKTSPGSLDAAISFIESAGGIEAAKEQIETIERIKNL